MNCKEIVRRFPYLSKYLLNKTFNFYGWVGLTPQQVFTKTENKARKYGDIRKFYKVCTILNEYAKIAEQGLRYSEISLNKFVKGLLPLCERANKVLQQDLQKIRRVIAKESGIPIKKVTEKDILKFGKHISWDLDFLSDWYGTSKQQRKVFMDLWKISIHPKDFSRRQKVLIIDKVMHLLHGAATLPFVLGMNFYSQEECISFMIIVLDNLRDGRRVTCN